MQQKRREILGAVSMAAGFGLAGCSSDLLGGDNSGDGDSTGGEAGTDEAGGTTVDSATGSGDENGESETATPQCADTEIIVAGPDGSTHCVAAVDSDQSIEEYYGYDTETQNSSALADGIAVADATIAFVYRNTATGDRSLVVVHDSPDGGTAGDVVMSFQGIDGMEWLVKDDPEPRSSSEAYETPGETEGDSMSAVWGWSGDSSLTDGGAIGPLGESFDITMTHHREGRAKETTASREGIDRWLFVDGADLDDPIELAEFTDESAGDSSIRLSTTEGGDSGDSADDGDGGGTTDDGGTDEEGGTTESEEDSSTTESGATEGTPTREISGEVSNDLTGLEVVDHEATVGEGGFAGTVTVRNVGDETATLVDHVIEFEVYDGDDSIVSSVGGWGAETKEPAPGEESVMEFFDGPVNDDIDFTQVESYVVVLTCDVFSEGVYCPEE
jgi:hypothetical protein